MVPETTDPEQPPSLAVETTHALFAAVYERLKAMAANQLARARPSATLQTTGLVHDLYLRMDHSPALSFAHRAQFFAYAAGPRVGAPIPSPCLPLNLQQCSLD